MICRFQGWQADSRRDKTPRSVVCAPFTYNLNTLYAFSYDISNWQHNLNGWSTSSQLGQLVKKKGHYVPGQNREKGRSQVMLLLRDKVCIGTKQETLKGALFNCGEEIQSQKVGNKTNSDILGSSRLSKVANHSSPTAVPNEMGYVMLPGCSGSTWRSALDAHRIGTHAHTPHPVACANVLHTVLGKPYPCTHTSYSFQAKKKWTVAVTPQQTPVLEKSRDVSTVMTLCKASM